MPRLVTLGEFETLNLSSTNDNLTISGDESATINGLGGNDQFTLDFSTIRTLNGGADTDTVKFSGNTGTNISTDTNFVFGSSSTTSNIEKLDITSLSLNTFDDTAEFNAFRDEFANIVDAGGSDTLSFGSAAVSGDLDFSKLGEFETLNLSGGNDTITFDDTAEFNAFRDEFANIVDAGGSDTLSFGSAG